MKKIFGFLIAFMLMITTAHAQGVNAVISDDNLSFNIFRFICSNLIMPEDKVQTEDSVTPPAIEEKESSASGDKDKEVRTLRDVVASMCVADSVSRSIVNGDDVVKVEFYTGDDKNIRECYFSDSSYTKSQDFTYEDISKGSIFYIRTDSEGMVSNYTVVAVINKSTKLYNVDEVAVNTNFNSSKVTYSYSYITDMRFRKEGTSVTLGNGDDLYITDDASEFTFDVSGRTPKVHTGSFTKAGVDVPEYEEDIDSTRVYSVFAMNYEDETVAICSLTTPVYVKGNIDD